MKSFAFFAAVLALGGTLVVSDAEAARRLGGGKSTGMQREMVAPQKTFNNAAPTPAAPATNQAAPTANRSQAAPGVPQAQPKRSWMGPLAGLAAGLGLAALASHFGFGEELASMLMVGLLVMAVMAAIGMIMRRRASAQRATVGGLGSMQYAGAGADLGRSNYTPAEFTPAGSAASTGSSGHIPADFDVEGFVRNAKVHFLRLQAANDAGNLDDIREFTTPEMFGEIKMNHVERGLGAQETDVVTMNAEVLDVAEETNRFVVSVRFSGLIREAKETAPESFDEIWHMLKPRDGSRGWVLAGIQQVQ